MSIDPLANPKGVKLLCELCQKPAFVQCTGCRVTYYCGQEHQKIDWQGIHEKICQLLVPLRTQLPFLPSQDERSYRTQQLYFRQKQMIDLTRTTGQKLLFEGRHDQAIPAAMQSLRFAIEVYGLASIELVPSYLILGEASIGLGRLVQAEEYLSQAQWTVLKTPECSHAIKSKLNRNLGLLHAAKGDFEEALRFLADDIYNAAEEYDTEDIQTCGGYYHMANVFFRQNKMDVADSLYTQVIDIWYEFLHKMVAARHAQNSQSKVLKQQATDGEHVLDEAQEAEALQVINSVCEIREQQATNQKALTKVLVTVAMMYFVLDNKMKCEEFGRKALASEMNEFVDENVLSMMNVKV